MIEFVYGEVEHFASAVAAEGGEQLIDSVLADPPESMEQILFIDA
ncbi:MAG: hypothetical protein ACI8Y4_003073 [Candidatus Poriferisodalaceae bacterium]|jgi:hypothetical protein